MGGRVVVRVGAPVIACALLAASCADRSDPPESRRVVTPSPVTPSPITAPPITAPRVVRSVVRDTASLPMPVASEPEEGSVIAEFAGEPWFLGRIPQRVSRADDALEPIRLGMINQEETPVGSYPEVRAAVEAAVSWVNAELGGVDGRPVELLTCVTPFDAQRSRECAEQLVDAGVVGFVGGVDVLGEGAAEVIEQRGLTSFGGIPANLGQQQSPNALFFSGGDAGALAGFMAHAVGSGVADVAIAYGSEVESFAVAAREYGARVGRSLGMQVSLVPFSMFAADFEPVVEQVEEVGADAVVVLAATSACVPVIEAAADRRLEVQLYLTGACASDEVIGAAERSGVSVMWNAEGPVDGDEVEASLYRAVVDRYATEPSGGAGTVGFRGFMNLYALLREAGGDDATPDTLAALARGAVDRPSFWGHPYTCDGRQVPGLPALCAPQQILFTIGGDGEFAAVTDWIRTDELFAAAID